jgi:hypothetical protein
VGYSYDSEQLHQQISFYMVENGLLQKYALQNIKETHLTPKSIKFAEDSLGKSLKQTMPVTVPVFRNASGSSLCSCYWANFAKFLDNFHGFSTNRFLPSIYTLQSFYSLKVHLLCGIKFSYTSDVSSTCYKFLTHK